MNMPEASDPPELATEPAFRNALAAAWPFGLFAALWAGALGIILSWGENFLTGEGFWQITLIMAICAFLAGTLAHMIVAGRTSLIRATLAGVLTPFIAVLFGAAVIAWGALPQMALTGLVFVALPLSLPCALLGLVYGAVRIRLLPTWRQRDDG